MGVIRQQIETLARKRRVKIGIGLLKPTDAILESFRRAAEVVDIVTIGTKVEGYENIPAEKDSIEMKECETVLSGKVEGLIRGQADTYRFEDALARLGGHDRTNILMFLMVEDNFGHSFFTTSGSHSDGWRKPHKKAQVDAIIDEMKKFGMTPKLGFLTWVRPGSVGRNFFFDMTWDVAEELVEHYRSRGYESKNYSIEIETALNEGVNLVVFANGTSGNMFGRIFTFLVKDAFIAYAHTGIKENIVENNRTLQDYYNLFLLAAARANGGK